MVSCKVQARFPDLIATAPHAVLLSRGSENNPSAGSCKFVELQAKETNYKLSVILSNLAIKALTQLLYST